MLDPACFLLRLGNFTVRNVNFRIQFVSVARLKIKKSVLSLHADLACSVMFFSSEEEHFNAAETIR